MRACGATEGGYVRVTAEAWIARFLRMGGTLCPDCRRVEGV